MNIVNLNLIKQLIDTQFPEYTCLQVTEVAKQGHDNRTYTLGDNMIIRIPTNERYVPAVHKEHKYLPEFEQRIKSAQIPAPVHKGKASDILPYPFSIYTYLPGYSVNSRDLTIDQMHMLAVDLAVFLKELQSITDIETIEPGQHNGYRGSNPKIYQNDMLKYIESLFNAAIIHEAIQAKSVVLWHRACQTQWHYNPVWIHGDLAIGNILVNDENKLTGVIDWSGIATGDASCDLSIAWTYFTREARKILLQLLDVDQDTILRSKAWTLWKAMFELYQITVHHKSNTVHSFEHNIHIIDEILYDFEN